MRTCTIAGGLLCLSAVGRALGSPPSLVDDPIASGLPPLYLDGASWTARNTGGPQATQSALPATVPGDILTDLQRAGRVDDPYWNTTWQQPDFIAAWNNGTWTYRTTFATPPAPPAATQFVVFDGIRMGATISLNGQFLGNATNQFLRYVFPAVPLASGGAQNVLEVTFGAELGIDCGGRWTFSGEIDWAPSMLTRDNATKRSTFGFGIWKSVYVLSIPAGSAAISQLAPTTWYQGGHPTTLLADDDHKGFDVHTDVELLAPAPVSGTVAVLGSWPGAVQVSQPVRLSKGNNTVKVIIPAAQTIRAKLWHPRGNGNQTLYTISASFAPSPAAPRLVPAAVPTTQRRMGFRHAVLITTNDSDAQVVADAPTQNGTGQFTMFFRVNGAPIYSRGANKIPMDLMEGRMSAAAHHRLVQSAAEANFNTLRVWGGGIWEPRAFFDACDEFGIMVYEDAMETFGEVDTEVHLHNDQLQRELEHQVRRLAHHPSVVLYSGCNECIYHDGGAFYELFITSRIAATDPSRVIWPHSPAPDGWSSGIDRLTTRPKAGQPLVVGVKPEGIGRPAGFNFPMEGHGPYVTAQYPGNLSELVARVMPAPGPVGVFTEFTIGAHEDPVAAKSWTGPQYVGWFQSEFGAISWPSFESASPSMPPNEWSINSAVAHTRNWNPSSFIDAVFGPQNMSEGGEAAFKRQLYQSQIAQALVIKTEVEAWRSTNNFGTLFWMYNELWATGGWGSIEYGSTAAPGQIEGGRWKPLHYLLKATAFHDQMGTCTSAGACFVRNDAASHFDGAVTVNLLNVVTGASVNTTVSHPLSMAPGAGTTTWFCANSESQRLSADRAPTTFARLKDQIPLARNNFTLHVVGNTSACEAACVHSGCIGFTMPEQLGQCWLYGHVEFLVSSPQADFYQNPGTAQLYTRAFGQAPVGGNAEANSSIAHGALNSSACQDHCSADASCVGFTQPNSAGYRCWFYQYQPSKLEPSGANWVQKAGSAIPPPAPAPPPPPPPYNPTPGPPCTPPPKAMECAPWNSTTQWHALGCDRNGSNCVVRVLVQQSSLDSTGLAGLQLITRNVLPFVPPKAMTLTTGAKVNATVDTSTTGTERVPIVVSANQTALFVVLTTAAPGRFSDNAFLLEKSESVTIDFISWDGPMNATGLMMLKTSLRVEHLAENLG